MTQTDRERAAVAMAEMSAQINMLTNLLVWIYANEIGTCRDPRAAYSENRKATLDCFRIVSAAPDTQPEAYDHAMQVAQTMLRNAEMFFDQVEARLKELGAI